MKEKDFYDDSSDYSKESEYLRLKDDNSGLSYISAVLYPLILIGVCFYIYNNNEISIIRLILGLIFAVATGISMGIGGFYLIIVPLPFIFIYKWGCTKPYLATWKKVLFGFMAVAFAFLVFIALFPA